MRIGIVAYPLGSRGGVYRWANATTDLLAAQGHVLHLIVGSRPEPSTWRRWDWTTNASATHEMPSATRRPSIKTARRLAELAARLGLDLVIAAQWYAIAVSLLAPLRSAKRVIAVQGAFPPALKGALYRLLVRALSGRADAVVAVSADLLGSMPEFARCKRRVVIPISVHVDRGPTNGRHPDMLYVGRLEPDKGVRDLVRLMYRSKQVALTIAGDGGLADEVQRAAHDLPHVSYLGWVDDPTELYRIHDYLVMPSHAEGCPHVLVEAIAHGAVPIVRDLPIARELGVPRPWRFGAIEEVPRIISDLRVASPPVVALQQARLRERVTARFSFPVVGAQWRELLSSVRPQ